MDDLWGTVGAFWSVAADFFNRNIEAFIIGIVVFAASATLQRATRVAGRAHIFAFGLVRRRIKSRKRRMFLWLWQMWKDPVWAEQVRYKEAYYFRRMVVLFVIQTVVVKGFAPPQPVESWYGQVYYLTWLFVNFSVAGYLGESVGSYAYYGAIFRRYRRLVMKHRTFAARRSKKAKQDNG